MRLNRHIAEMNKRLQVWWKCLALLLVILVSGCQTPPKYLRAGFEPESVDRIAVLPVMDDRKRADPKHDFQYLSTSASEFVLQAVRFKRRYCGINTADIGNVSDYSTAIVQAKNLKQPIDPSIVKQMGPVRARWILVPVLHAVGGWGALLASGSSAEVSLYLFNKENGELVWNGAAIGRVSAMGLLDVIILEAFDKELISISLAADHAAQSLPKRKNSMNKGGGDWIAQQERVREFHDLQKIAVTLPIDGRVRMTQDKPIDPSAYQAEIVKRLNKRGFEAYSVDGFGQGTTMPVKEQVVFSDAEFGKSLASLGTKYVMIPIIEMTKNKVFPVHAVGMYLFDTTTGERIWEGVGSNPGGFDNSIITVIREGLPKRAELSK